MGRVLRITLAVPVDVAAFVADLDTPPWLAGQLLAEVVTCSQGWHIGAPYIGEDAAPVGVVLLLRDRLADALLDAPPEAQGDILRRALWVSGWMFVGAEDTTTLWPPVALEAVTGDAMRRAEDSRDEWTGMAIPPASARFAPRPVNVN